MSSAITKFLTKLNRKKEDEEKKGKEKNLDLFHSLGVAKHFFPPLLHESQKGPSFTSLKFHGDGNIKKEKRA
jgi:hypothetical protein